jgi:ornithine cyclodeaminase
MPREILVLRESEIRQVLDMESCIDAMARAFTSYSAGEAELPDVIHLNVPEHDGEIHIKTGHLHGEPFFAVKVASGFYENPALGLPSSDGMVAVFDATTGGAAAFLLDNGYMTDLRTGAAGGVAARHLAPAEPEVVAVVGTGAQARHQIDALSRARSFREVRVWGRDEGRARACAADLAALPAIPEGCRVSVAATVAEAVDGAAVVVTVTASQEPLVRPEWIAPGTHVTAVGSDGPDKQELDGGVLAAADLVVADSLPQCLRLGEIHHAVDAGVLRAEDVVELGRITAGAAPGRTSENQRTVADLTGVGVQDVAAANLVMRRADGAGMGVRIQR